MTQVERLIAESAELILSELRSRFPGARNVQDVWCMYASMEARAIAAESTLNLLASPKMKFRSKTSEYRIWQQIFQRCENQRSKAWNDYGGRGIRVCDRWRSFELFMADVGTRPSTRHSLDRYPNNNGNYEPSNCRWATKKEQARNRRSGHLIEVNGIERPLIEWAELFNVLPETIHSRLRSGVSPSVAVSTPPRRNGPKRESARVGTDEWRQRIKVDSSESTK